jgi:hypothetical protein
VSKKVNDKRIIEIETVKKIKRNTSVNCFNEVYVSNSCLKKKKKKDKCVPQKKAAGVLLLKQG